LQEKTMQSETGRIQKLLFLVAGILAVVIGLIGSSLGSAWSPRVYDFLFAFEVIASIDTFMPYFPMVPFYPIFIMMLGAFLIVKSRG